MDTAVILLNFVLSLILLGTGLSLLKKHSPYPDFSSGYHHKAAMESRETWETANRRAGILCIAEGIFLFLARPALFYLGMTGPAFFAVWLALAVIAVLLAVFLPALTLKIGRKRP